MLYATELLLQHKCNSKEIHSLWSYIVRFIFVLHREQGSCRMSRQLVRYSSVYSNGTSTAPCCKHHSGSSRHNHSLNARKQVGEIWVSSFYQKLSNQKYPWIFPRGPCFLRRRGIDGSFLVTLLTVIYIKRRYHWKFGFKKSDRWSVLGLT